MSVVNSEADLYEPVQTWLQGFLEETLKKKALAVKSYIGADEVLSRILIREGLIDNISNAALFDLKIDVFAVVTFKNRTELVIVECKKDTLGLIDLGQLIGYSQIIKPWISILLSPRGATSGLHNFLVNHGMDHLLSYGDDRRSLITKWDVIRKAPDYFSVIPRGALDPVSIV